MGQEKASVPSFPDLACGGAEHRTGREMLGLALADAGLRSHQARAVSLQEAQGVG